jgi:small GTP-binding protein
MSTAHATCNLALLGNPNCGKTALFNLLTGSRQKVANYPGVTVDRKEGQLTTPSGKTFRILDLPGAYSLNAVSIDEEITRDVVLGTRADEQRPDLIVCVSDATNLKLNLRLVLEVKRLGLPMVLALNMTDLAAKRGIVIDVSALERELGMPVVSTIAVKRGGAGELISRLEAMAAGYGCSAGVLAAARCSRRHRHPARSTADSRGHRPRTSDRHPPRRAHRSRRAAPGMGNAHSGGHAVPDVPGGVQLGQPADGPGSRRAPAGRRVSRERRGCRRASCAACWSTASSPASAACWCSCRRS